MISTEATKTNFARSMPEVDYAQAYAWQYTSLMILLLSVVMGTFTIAKVNKQKNSGFEEVSSVNSAKNPVNPVKLQEIDLPVYNQLFLSDSLNIDREKADAISEVLKNHDLIVQIEIKIERDDSSSNFELEKALDKAEVLFKYFRAQAVPVEALKILAVDNNNLKDTKVSFLKIGSVAAGPDKATQELTANE